MRTKAFLPLLFGMLLCAPTIVRAATDGFFDVKLNGKPTQAVAYARAGFDGRVLMARADFAALNINASIPESVDMVDLAQAGLTATLDPAANELRIEAPASMFEGGALEASARRVAEALPVVPGAYLNYRAQAMYDARGPGGAIALDAAAFGAWGFLTATAAAGISGGRTTATLTDAAYAWDNPRERTTLLVGDSETTAGVTGQSVRIGGVAYRRNWTLDPTFITTPMPMFRGEAKLPTTLDVLLDGRPVSSKEVPAGPWTLTNLPVLSSSGTLQLVAKDALGNETVQVLPFYIAPRLLSQGLTEFSYEAGAARRDYGTRSFSYSTAVASGTHRVGLTDELTVEAHGEATQRQVTLGAGAAVNFGNRAIGSAYAAGSHSDAGNGALVGYGVQSQDTTVSASLAQAWRSRDYEGLGDAVTPSLITPRDKLLTAAQLTVGSLSWLPRTSFSLSAAIKTRWNAPTQSFYGVTGTTNIGGVSVTASLFSTSGSGGGNGPGAMLSVTVPFGGTAVASSSVQKQSGTLQAVAEYQQPLPPGDGYGYAIRGNSVSNSTHGAQSLFASGAQQDRTGQRGIEATSSGNTTAGRAWATGSLGVVDGTPFIARVQDGAFAIVDAGRAPGIEIFRENNPITTTNEQGRAVLTGLRPFEPVRISISPGQVPFGWRIGSTDILATPLTRGAVRIAFDLQRERGVIVVLHRPDGSPVPAGAVVKLAGSNTETVVGRRGEAYLDNIPDAADLTVRYRGQQCRVHADVPAGDDPQPRIGPLTCALAKEAP